MVFDITQLKKIRKQLGLTQHGFAKEAGMSQSMIAKIEAGRLDPTYSYVKKIELALKSVIKHEEKKAKEIMHSKIYSAKRNDSIEKVVQLMTKHDISQVPVIEKEHVVGLITESDLLEIDDAKKIKVKDKMQEAPPIIDENAELSVVLSLLKFYPIVIVRREGLRGVITKADLIRSLVR